MQNEFGQIQAFQLFQSAKQQHAAHLLASAAHTYRQALALAPDHPEILLGYAMLASDLQDWRSAATLFKHLGEVHPGANVEGHVGVALFNQGQYTEALDWLRRDSHRHPDNPACLMQLGSCLGKLRRWREALSLFQQALRLRGSADAELCKCLLATYNNLGDRENNDVLVKKVLDEYPDSAELQSLCAQHLLKSGDYARGFGYFKKRWAVLPGRHESLELDCPEWDGQAFDGTLLVAAEQGLGDEILFSSMFADLVALPQRALIECDLRLLPLLRRSFPALDFVPRNQGELAAVCTADDTRVFRKIDAGDLGYHFRRHGGFAARCEPSHRGWLIPDPDKVAALHARYRALFGNKLLVGISWRSRSARGERTHAEQKSIDLLQLAPLIACQEAVFINLQYGDIAADIARLHQQSDAAIYADPEVDTSADIDTLVAQIAALDLVISSSNSTAHIAGATGAPCWLLLPHACTLLWYWGYAGTTTPWYPSLALWRCESPGAWSPLIKRACKALVERIAADPST